MPPNAKIDRQNILQAAFVLVRENGTDAVTARNIARKLRCSTQPIFRIYANMDALKKELYVYTNKFFEQYLTVQCDEGTAFFNIGFRYIQFAKEEKNLFKMMFMSGRVQSDNLIELFTSDENVGIMKTIPDFSKYTDRQIKSLFLKIAFFTHGIAALVAANEIEFDSHAVGKLLTDLFHALIKDINDIKDINKET